jgi:hypothetical protein
MIRLSHTEISIKKRKKRNVLFVLIENSATRKLVMLFSTVTFKSVVS